MRDLCVRCVCLFAVDLTRPQVEDAWAREPVPMSNVIEVQNFLMGYEEDPARYRVTDHKGNPLPLLAVTSAAGARVCVRHAWEALT